jgi:DNA-directed RNA polymerase sigma subunit (sigma70/sigma32)
MSPSTPEQNARSLEERTARREAMLALRGQGWTLGGIALAYGVTRERVRAILAKPVQRAGRRWPSREEREARMNDPHDVVIGDKP